MRTRMGDGYVTGLTPQELRDELGAGSADAVKRGKVPPLEENEIDWLVDLFANPSRIMGVDPGHQVILTRVGWRRATGVSNDSTHQAVDGWPGGRPGPSAPRQ